MLADDLTQDALSKALSKLDQLKKMESLNAWMYSILNNQWREYLRRNRACEDLDDVILVSESNPEDWHNRQQKVDKVQAAISQLPNGQRQALSLVDIEGMTYMEVSEILDIPVGTVMSRLNRARKSLQTHLMKEEKMQTVIRLRSV